ncbi:MAG TPA: hypothetical protein VF074_09105, partial [Pyrinomonadaceae bacterium]
WIIQVLSTKTASTQHRRAAHELEKYIATKFAARKYVGQLLCRKDLNHPHTAVCGILFKSHARNQHCSESIGTAAVG